MDLYSLEKNEIKHVLDDPDSGNPEMTDLMKKMIQQLNCIGGRSDAESVVATLRSTHRTLQQNFMREVILPAIYLFAWKHRNGWTDARNEETCKIAHEIAELLTKRQTRDALPYI